MRRFSFVFSRLFIPVFFIIAILPSTSFAVTFRRPLDQILNPVVSYYYDNNSSWNAVNYQCGWSSVYDNHRGTDFRASRYTPIYAAASGQLNYRYDNCASTGYLGSSCGGGFGNHVRIAHNDSTTIYAHMQRGTPAWYHYTSCSNYVGQVGSSGSSTAPHLHFEVRKRGYPFDDPYTGACNARGDGRSYWYSQWMSNPGEPYGTPAPWCGS